MSDDKDMARPADQALVSDQAPAGLAPTGFDPSRYAVLAREVGTHRAVSVIYSCSREHWAEAVIGGIPRHIECEFSAIPRDDVSTGSDWFQRTIDSADHLPWLSAGQLAIAIEARSDATQCVPQGESAGLQASPNSSNSPSQGSQQG